MRTILATSVLALGLISAAMADDPASTRPAPPVGPPTSVHWKKITLADGFYSEGAAFGDFNGDGKQDVVAGGVWYEGPDFTVKHTFADYPKTDPHTYTNQFLTFAHSFKHDAYDDVIAVSWPGKDTSWYENPRQKGEAIWKKHVIFNETDNESPTFADLFKNGKPVLVCGTGGTNPDGGQVGYAQPDETDPTQPWKFHAISPRSKRYFRYLHGLGIGDVNGDGRNDILIADGWFEQPADLTGDPEWKFHPAQFFDPKYGDGCAQMYVYDVNDDGRPDVICSLQAHGHGLAWFEQNVDGTFTKHLIIGSKASDSPQGVVFSQLHALAMIDIDGDGLSDLVTGKRWWAHGPTGDIDTNGPPVLYWFQLVRHPDHTAEFIPHLVDDNSGGSTQIAVADINHDHHPAILVGNKRGTYLFLQEPPAK
jgi:hypothetical protein